MTRLQTGLPHNNVNRQFLKRKFTTRAVVGKHSSSVVVLGDQGCGADCLPQGVKTVREEKRREKSDLIIIVLCVGERVENVP